MARDDLVVSFDEEMAELDKPTDTEYQPLYKMVANNKIAISKKEGTLWAQRLAYAKKKMDLLHKEWQYNIDTYMAKGKPSGSPYQKQLRLNEKEYDYENLVWSNTIALNRETIMKLPHIELTTDNEEYEQIGKVLEHAINKYMGSTGNNGINMKEKLRKADVGAQLTNRGIIRLDWNETIDGDDIRDQINKIETKLSEEGISIETVKKLEGQLFSLNEKLEESGMSGLQLTLVDPINLFIDPNSQLETGLDADWMIEKRYELRSVLKAKYGSEEGTVYAGDKSEIGGDATEEHKNDYVLGDDERSDMEKKSSDLIATVYYVWDKLKKRTYLYEEGKWDYPLWVWEDRYNLEQFFPYFILSYNIDPYSNHSLSECSYYLPIQNQINDINSKLKNARDRAFNVVLIDSNSRLENKDMENMTNGKAGYVKIRVPEGKRLQDVVTGMPTAGLDQIFMDKSGLYAIMQKMTSADPTSRGEEYRTNTTNMAIQQYTGAKKITIGIRVDNIIAFYIRICKEVMKLMIENFKVTDWSKVLNSNEAEFISNTPLVFNDLDYQWAGDDTVEPTSAMKKQEAVQLSQIMGQFAGATPAITIVMLKLMSRAFNEVVITDEDWQMIWQGLQAQQQQPPQGQQMPPQGQQQQMPPQEMPPMEQQLPQEDIINQAAMMEG